MQLLLDILRPLDNWSVLLLQSNFVEVLARQVLERSEDWKILDSAACIAHVVSAFQELPCTCDVCLRGLKGSKLVSMGHSMNTNVSLDPHE